MLLGLLYGLICLQIRAQTSHLQWKHGTLSINGTTQFKRPLESKSLFDSFAIGTSGGKKYIYRQPKATNNPYGFGFPSNLISLESSYQSAWSVPSKNSFLDCRGLSSCCIFTWQTRGQGWDTLVSFLKMPLIPL